MKPAIAHQQPVSASAPSRSSERPSAAARRVALVTEATPTANTSPIWEPTPVAPNATPTSSEVLNAAAPRCAISATVESELIGIITRPIGEYETHQTGNENRERELRSYLASLSPLEAFTLRKRLDNDRSDDNIAVAFRRLLSERRQRLRAFLASPRRHLG